MRARALPFLCIAVAGCRAVLGIEDPPDENGAGGSPTTTTSPSGPESAAATSAGDGGAPGATTGSTPITSGDGGSAAMATGAITAGVGGAGGDASGGGAPTDVFDLDATGFRLAWDADDPRLYVVDVAGGFWALSSDFSSVQHCVDDTLADDSNTEAYLAAIQRDVAFSRYGVIHYLNLRADWNDDQPISCTTGIHPLGLAGLAIREGAFYGISSDALVYEVDPRAGELPYEVAAPEGVYGGTDLAFGSTHLYGAATSDLGGVIARYDIDNSYADVVPELTAVNGTFVAVTADDLDTPYAVQLVDDRRKLVTIFAELSQLPDYDGPTRLSVQSQGSFVFVTGQEYVIVCKEAICKIRPGNEQHVADVKATDGGTFVLQGTQLLRYEPMTDEVFATLPLLPG